MLLGLMQTGTQSVLTLQPSVTSCSPSFASACQSSAVSMSDTSSEPVVVPSTSQPELSHPPLKQQPSGESSATTQLIEALIPVKADIAQQAKSQEEDLRPITPPPGVQNVQRPATPAEPTKAPVCEVKPKKNGVQFRGVRQRPVSPRISCTSNVYLVLGLLCCSRLPSAERSKNVSLWCTTATLTFDMHSSSLDCIRF